MQANTFRKLALALPEAVESSHMGHPDFRVGGKVFATLAPDDSWGGLKLTPAQQAEFVAESPDGFQPANGAWGRQGFTLATLTKVKVAAVRLALTMAWRNTAPQKLVDQWDEG